MQSVKKKKNWASTLKKKKLFYSSLMQSFYQHLNVGKFHEKA